MELDLMFKYLNDAQERIELAKMYFEVYELRAESAESEKPIENGPSNTETFQSTVQYYSKKIEESLDSLLEQCLV